MRSPAAMLGLCVLLSAGTAQAQLHWDASAQAGPVKRWLADKPSGGDDATFGGEARVATHVALLPLVRVGAYGTFDVTGDGDATRFLAGGGLRAKVFAPLPAGSFRAWLFAGFGLLGAWSPAYTSRFTVQRPLDVVPSTVEAEAAKASGRLFEIPVGAGVSWKVWGPYSFTAELGLRVGVAHAGPLYEAPGRSLSLSSRGPVGLFDSDLRAPIQGLDRFAVGLTVGVLYDR